jgi:uncharacterized membrane protein
MRVVAIIFLLTSSSSICMLSMPLSSRTSRAPVTPPSELLAQAHIFYAEVMSGIDIPAPHSFSAY